MTPARLKRRRLLATIVATVAAAANGGADAQSDEELELESVRQEIRAVEERLARQTTRRDATVAALRSAELAVAAANEELARIRGRLRAQRARLAEIEASSSAAAGKLERERTALAEQVRASYIAGSEELVKLLLSQEDPAALGRMLVYYDYYNAARTSRIEAVSGHLADLAALAAEGRSVERELEELQGEQAHELAARESARGERRQALTRLDASIETAAGRIDTLKREEARLAELVAELALLLADYPGGSEEPFAALKGRLAWPVQGTLAQAYGQPRGGGALRWNGVVLAAEAGTAVRAVYHGRIAFSDWLPGLGLLVIVDHGAGYMSLYGHNEALLKESGEWVAPGEVIAQVGDSGGRPETGLYFEIRRDGEPVDPGQWMAQRR